MKPVKDWLQADQSSIIASGEEIGISKSQLDSPVPKWPRLLQLTSGVNSMTSGAVPCMRWLWAVTEAAWAAAAELSTAMAEAPTALVVFELSLTAGLLSFCVDSISVEIRRLGKCVFSDFSEN